MAFVAAAQAGDGQSATTSSLSITIPAGASVGDAAILVVNADGTPTLTTPSGWTLDRTDTGATNSTAWVFKKILVGGDPGASVSLAFGASVRCGADMLVHSGRTLTGLQIAVTTDSASTSSYVLPGLTGVPSGADLLAFWARRRSGAAGNISVPAPYTNPTGGDYANAYGTGVNTFGKAGYVAGSGGGSVGGETATTAVTSIGYSYLISLPVSGTTYDVARQDAGRGWDTAAVALATQFSAAGQDAGRGWDTASVEVQHQFSAARQDSGRGWDRVDAQLIKPPPVKPPTQHAWSAFSRTPGYAPDLALPILSAKFVRRHLGVSTCVLTTPYTEARYASLQPGHGVELYRDGRQEFTGLVAALDLDWDGQTGQRTITVQAEGDETVLADSLVFPDPLRAADDQTVNDYWKTRVAGTATAKTASAAMYQLISDMVGATAKADRQITGLTLGADPGVGLSRIWSALFNEKDNALGTLTAISVASGANLGLRVTSAAGVLTVTVVQPRNLASAVRFSADLGNLVGFHHHIERPKVTHALAAGQGDLHLRVRKLVATVDAFALSWGRRIWAYIDRRDTADTTELTAAATDALEDGVPSVSLTCDLRDTVGARYGVDYDLGDKVTVYVGFPGETKVATVADVIREIAFEVFPTGAERITPAIGSWDAKAVIPTPTQKQLLRVGQRLAGLEARK